MAYRMSVFYDRKAECRAQFLRHCHLCKRTLGEGDDLFMYRGDTPFCSDECRQEQIDLDEETEKARHASRAMRAKNKKASSLVEREQRESSSQSDRMRVLSDVVAVA